MAQLIDWLALAGARTSAGAAVSSGTVWFYEPGGGTTLASVYSDADGTIVAANPATLDAGGRATVYTIAPVRVVVQTAAGADVSDTDQGNVNRAEAVQVDNPYWTDGYLDGVLSKIGASVLGTDAMFKESSGATARTIAAKFSELSISVKDFGATGGGIAIDTTGIQAAINRIAFLGGGEVYFPPGTYLIDQGLTCATSGVSFRGAKATLQNTSTSNTLLTCTGMAGFSIRDLTITDSSNSSGAAITLSGCTRVQVSGVATTRHYKGLNIGGTAPGIITVDSCIFEAVDAQATARGIAATDCNGLAITNTYTYGGTTGYGMECLGSTNGVSAVGCSFNTVGVAFHSALSGSGFRFTACTLPAIPFIFGAANMPIGFYQAGNGADGYSVDVATGGTTVLTLAKGRDIRIKGITGAGTVTVSNPTVLPSTSDRDVHFITRHVNAAGGACAWAMDTVFVLDGAVAIPTTDARTILVDWLWDGTTSKLREVSRSTTVT